MRYFFPWGIEFNCFPDEKVERKKAEMDFSCSLSQIILLFIIIVYYYFRPGTCLQVRSIFIWDLVWRLQTWF